MKLMVQKRLSSFLKSALSQKKKERKFGLERRKESKFLKSRRIKNLKNDVHKPNKVNNILKLNPEKTETFF